MPDHEQLIEAAGLMPHAPILIPEVGGGREKDAAQSVQAMRRVSRRLLAGKPERLVLISPHSPRWPGIFGVWPAARLHGSLEPFGCPQVELDLANDPAFLRSLKLKAEARALRLKDIPDRCLDHGAIVPLYFLVEAGWHGPTVVLGLNYPGDGGLAELGQCIAAAVEECGGKTAVIASGDMSHRLKPDAPAGFHPKARLFDEAFVSLVRRGRYDLLPVIDPAL
ncbi:MAG TPA: class III extradiol dioxygenase subunit B-like domain-containing protein, partial [Verrucomicrobiae bacterium]|nr:class III extradiol dioxygenase subunit B-like domain-containing protein [Verrucomicrobiae bacterium]